LKFERYSGFDRFGFVLNRPLALRRLVTALGRAPVTALLGARQCGKTTLARMLGQKRKIRYFDLEDMADRSRLQNPALALASLRGVVVLDEAQRMQELFEALRVLVDRTGHGARYVIPGSASPSLVRGVSESLAGRVEFVELGGFDLGETGAESLERLWIRGGFPRSFLARSDRDSLAWRESFIRTFLERDVPQLGLTIPAPAMRRFWTMLAHNHGQTWNASKLARSMGLSDKTVRSYLDILTGTFLVRQLQPWHTTGHARSRRPRSTSGTPESCTACSESTIAMTCSATRRPAPPGKGLPWSRRWQSFARRRLSSGQRIQEPSWTCSFSIVDTGSALSSC
jgi:predicted AAA+ superfamily ATPase